MKSCLTILLCFVLVVSLAVTAAYFLLPEGFLSITERQGEVEQSQLEESLYIPDPPSVLGEGISDAEELSHLMAQALRDFQPSLEVEIRLPSAGTDKEAYLLKLVEEAYISLRRNYPDIFWMSMGQYGIQWSASADGVVIPLTIELNYCMDVGRAEALGQEMDGIVASLVAQAPADSYEAVKFFHDWIVNNTVYDIVVAETDIMEGNEQAYNIHGVFLEGTAVCEAYAKAFQLLCDQRGINACIVFGTSEGENHAWNYVQLDGGWYLVDCTADDPVSDRDILRWNYFLRGTESILEDGKTVWDIYRTDNGDYPYLSPYDYDNGEQAATAVQAGTVHEVYSVELLLTDTLRQGSELTQPGGRIGLIRADGTEEAYNYQLSEDGRDNGKFYLDAASGQLSVGNQSLSSGAYEIIVQVIGQEVSAVATVRFDVTK